MAFGVSRFTCDPGQKSHGEPMLNGEIRNGFLSENKINGERQGGGVKNHVPLMMDSDTC